MAYSDFSLRKALQDFDLSTQDEVFFRAIDPIIPSSYLLEFLERSLPLAIAIGTEKARSELLVSPILLEVREQLERKISFFSGIDFTVDASLGLNGVCDFLMSRSPEQMLLTEPVAVVVEAKRGELDSGMGQCLAEMVAAQKFNRDRGNEVSTIYGSVTSGSLWRFLKLENQKVTFDLTEYAIPPIDRVLGLLVHAASA